MKKKSQIAMETLMVYGIAILIVMLAIGALIYFGVLDLGSYLPDKCTIVGAEMSCETFEIGKTNDLKMEVQNLMGKNIDYMELISCVETEVNDRGAILVSGECGSADAETFSDPDGNLLVEADAVESLLNGELGYVETYNCHVIDEVKTGSKVKLTCTLGYKLIGSGLSREATVNVITTVLE